MGNVIEMFVMCSLDLTESERGQFVHGGALEVTTVIFSILFFHMLYFLFYIWGGAIRCCKKQKTKKSAGKMNGLLGLLFCRKWSVNDCTFTILDSNVLVLFLFSFLF